MCVICLLGTLPKYVYIVYNFTLIPKHVFFVGLRVLKVSGKLLGRLHRVFGHIWFHYSSDVAI